MAERSLTIKIVGDAKDMRRAARDVKSSLDETESAGKALARAIDTMSEDMQRNFRDAADTTRVLEEALGQDTVAALQSVGRNVEDMVREWKQAGLTYDEIRADADEVARALRDSVQAGRDLGTIGTAADGAESKVRQLGDTADTTRGHIADVRDSADQSRSVLANMVGNSAQDVGELGGVVGTLGVGLGQMAEYAVDGNINLAGLAAFAGPMAAVALGGIAISKAVGAIRDNAEQAKKETELWLGVQEKVVAGQTREAMAGLAEEYDGTLDSLEELGYTAGDWVDAMRGQKDLVGDLSTRYEVLGSKLANAVDPAHALTEAELDEYNILSKLIPNLREQTENRDNAVIAMDEEKRRVDILTSAYQGQQPVNLALINQYGRIIDRVEGVGEVMADTADDGVDPLQQALDDLGVQYDKLMDKFDDREAVDKMNEALADLMITMADQESSWTDLRQKSDDYARSLADVIMSMDDVPTEVKSQLLAWVDQGQLDLVKGQLDAIAKTRTAEFQILVEAVASAELKQMENRLNRDINGNGVIGRAAGGPVWPGGVFAVGDNADGSWNPTTELFVPNTAGRIMSAGDSRAAMGGATYISVNVAVPTAVDRGAVGREIAEALLEYQREAGPVFMTTRS